MKPSDSAEVLIPQLDKLSSATGMTGTGLGGGQPPYVFTNIIGSTRKPTTSTCTKLTAALVAIFMIALTASTVCIVLRYEGKLSHYESRMVTLESQLEDFIEAFEIKTLIQSIQDHAHDDDRLDNEFDGVDSAEIDFSNDVVEPPVLDAQSSEFLQAAAPLRPLPRFRPQFPRINDMSDEDFLVTSAMLKKEDPSLHFQFEDIENDSSSESEEDSVSNEFITSATMPTIEGDEDKGNDNDEAQEERIEEDIVFGEIKLETPHASNNKLSRSKRQTRERTSDGVPILDSSYQPSDAAKKFTLPLPTPTESEGLRLYESLVATGGVGEPKAPEYTESDGTNVQPYHRASAAWTERSGSRLELKSGDYGYGSGPTVASDQFYVRSRPTTPAAAYGAGSNAVHRRVSPTEDGRTGPRRRTYSNRNQYNYPPLRKIGEGDGQVVARVHQEAAEPLGQATSGANFDDSTVSFAESRHYRNIARKNASGMGQRYRHRQQQQQGGDRPTRQRKQAYEKEDSDYDEEDVEDVSAAKDEFSFVKAEAWAEGPKTYAAHYVGDHSNYTTAHRHYDGNGRLRNADGIFSDWKAASWMTGNEASKDGFHLHPNGVITIKKEGIYYIYAQIHYLDEHDVNGFQIQINSQPFLQCTTMTETHHSNSRKNKSNTCYTGGISHIKENDQIVLKDVEMNRYAIVKPEKSFFGFMRIGPFGGGGR